MIPQIRKHVKDRRLGSNMSFKLVSLTVALILWAIMLGRKDITLSKELGTQILVPPNMEVVSGLPSKVQVEVSGPRISLKKFSSGDAVYTLDLEGLPEGTHVVQLTKEGLSLPLGVKILSLKPKEVRAVIRSLPSQ